MWKNILDVSNHSESRRISTDNSDVKTQKKPTSTKKKHVMLMSKKIKNQMTI